MEIADFATDQAVLVEIGHRLGQLRLNQNKTQAQFAEEAGVSKRTIERLESGQSVQLANFIRVCRQLDLLKRLDALIPPPVPSPLAQVKLQGKVRRRARQRKLTSDVAESWTWGDES